MKELELHSRLEAAHRLVVGERQRMTADGARDGRDEQRQPGEGQQQSALSGMHDST
jgi:hypothetical protein